MLSRRISRQHIVNAERDGTRTIHAAHQGQAHLAAELGGRHDEVLGRRHELDSLLDLEPDVRVFEDGNVGAVFADDVLWVDDEDHGNEEGARVHDDKDDIDCVGDADGLGLVNV